MSREGQQRKARRNEDLERKARPVGARPNECAVLLYRHFTFRAYNPTTVQSYLSNQ